MLPENPTDDALLTEMQTLISESASPRELEEAKQIAAELGRRRMESLRLWEPLEFQEQAHTSRASERVVRKGNRAGGSVWGSVETGRAATGQDPHQKYPTDRPLVIWLVGLGLSHIGRVFHRLLFKPGAFRIVKDPVTKVWRTFKPW